MPKSANVRAAIFMLLAMATFTIGDTITKYVVRDIGSVQYMLVRGVMASLIIGFIAWRSGALRQPSFDLMTILRVLGEVLATITYIYSLAHLSQVFCSAVFQSTPLLVTMAAALFLGEKVGWRRWTCIGIGFIGVLIILRPGTDGAISGWPIIVLLSSIGFAVLRDITTRRVPAHVSGLYLSFITAIAITITGGAMLPSSGGWQPTSPGNFALMLIAASLLLVGYHFIILAMREGEVSFVAPFRYSSLLWATLLSTVVFNQAPDIYTVIGSTLVVGSGIFMVYREHVLRKRSDQRSTLAATPTGVEPS